MIKNPKLIEYIHQHFDNLDDCEDCLLLCTCVELDNIEFLYRREIVKTYDEEQELFHKFRIMFMERNIDTDSLQAKYKLRFPLFVNEVEEDIYDEFYKWLVKNPKLVAHKGRFSNTIEGKKAFGELLNKDFDINRFKASVETYYNREGQYAKALPKFLVENSKGEYEGFKEAKSKLI